MNRQAFQHPSGNGMRSVVPDLTIKLLGSIFQALCILAGVVPWSVTAGPADNAKPAAPARSDVIARVQQRAAELVPLPQPDIAPVFTPEEVRTYTPKGATQCFRQFCLDYNWSGRTLNDLPLKFTKADPVAIAEFGRKHNLDAVLLLAVPHHGYCTYNTTAGVRFPMIQDDWYGRCIRELHQRNISVLGYITLGTNWKFMRDHAGEPFVHSALQPDGILPATDGLCLNAPGYQDLVETYTRELLSRYPVDALRYDMLFSARGCLCDGCKAYYKELYGEELKSWQGVPWRRQSEFYLATLRRPVDRLTKAARDVKPSVEIWQNHINTYSEADLNSGRQHDIAYIEFGEPARLLALRGILNKEGIIVGQTLTTPIRRMIMALGARCYQYVSVDQATALPGDMPEIAAFFKMVAEVQPYLEHARTLSHIGLVYSEATRYRFGNFDRGPYMKPCEEITKSYLQSSIPLDFINCLDLTNKDLSGYKLLMLPLTSGLAPGELDVLRKYVRNGGNLLIAGDALRHDEHGLARPEFELTEEMGAKFLKVEHDAAGIAGDWPGGEVPANLQIKEHVVVSPVGGNSLLRISKQDLVSPLLHVNRVGQGRIAYLASVDSIDLIRRTADWLAGPLPLRVTPPGRQVILTRQAKDNRWILHLLGDDAITVSIGADFAPVREVAALYPPKGWDCTLEKTPDGVKIIASGNAKDRLVVLK